ncbi:diacylglycerol kinase family protein [Candidatus Woesebacteria bacterium]|jgi:diacylglycerol kinase|nr:diacylglycerol kinase family protein [Candidatus Woesebacteria bacterium]
MEKMLKQHQDSFKNAFAGLFWSLKTQPNFRVHMSISVVVLLFAWYLGVSRAEFGVLIFTVLLGLSAEMINTSLECMTDLITHEWREDAKRAKDVAAGMMLLVAMGAAVIGLWILGPYIVLRFF